MRLLNYWHILKITLIKSENITTELLTHLYNDGTKNQYINMKQHIAINDKTSLETLEILSEHKDKDVLAGVVENKNITIDMLKKIESFAFEKERKGIFTYSDIFRKANKYKLEKEKEKNKNKKKYIIYLN